MTKPHWRDSALCRQVDPELFFPDPHHRLRHRIATRQAKQVCASCPVRTACLNAALEGCEPYGVWGGLTELERRRLLRRNTRSPQKAVA